MTNCMTTAPGVVGHVIPPGCRQVIPPPGRASGAGLLGCYGGCLAGVVSGSFAGSVAGSVHEDLVAGVDQPVEERFGDDGVREQVVPVLGCTVAREDQRFAVDCSIADQ